MATEKEAKIKFCSKSFEENDDGSLTGLISFVFGNGAERSVNVFEVPEDTQRRLTVHGGLQKCGDSYASADGDYAVGIAKLDAVIENLKAGTWKGERGEAGPRLVELSAAIARIKAVTVEVARAAVEKATDEQRKTWRNNARVKSAIADIRAEEAAKALEAAATEELVVEGL